MSQYINLGFASKTFGKYLDLRCQEHGLSRRNAVKAAGQVKIIGTPGTMVPTGTVVSTTADPLTNTRSVSFATTATATIAADGSVYVGIEAVEPGVKGNVSAGKINLMAIPVSGISSVINESTTTGGCDLESDSALLSRYLVKVQTPGTSGNKADYLNWALEVNGVGNAQVIPLWDGPGTVKVVLLDTESKPAGQAIVDTVQAYIAPEPARGERKAPVGADVTVVPAAAISLDISAAVEYTGTKTLSDIRISFEKALQEYLKSIAFSSDPTARYVRIGSLLLDTEGVKDYSNLLVNGSESNAVVSEGQVAVMGTVNLSV
ncbi:hypothetical protein N752_29190 [Desulforamulus aquiferis]|nr:baseplate J/gp47 family protein [Desulforamulus aquiferis]RYD01655.1 hypothetical protein N752_29190 [Desulforamulus aquiferis]